ncbi:hypothetical protein Hanom_Chr03g00196241 [Helianthus anomalus]
MEVTSTLYMLQTDMYLILLTASSQALFHLKECRLVFFFSFLMSKNVVKWLI